ncbi:MAG TPA: helix-turn-helix domain-containing protein [Flavipsychrobacter sp.]|nr:helix-turn-helix domain-containing protein [Flavipsychrobacter sp.]
MQIHTESSCKKARLAIRDTLDVVGGKWKLVLLTILRSGKKRFRELSKEAEISPRILSKELKEMEMDGLVTRTVCNTKPITVEYALTAYSTTLDDVLNALHQWGEQHRTRMMSSEQQLPSETLTAKQAEFLNDRMLLEA